MQTSRCNGLFNGKFGGGGGGGHFGVSSLVWSGVNYKCVWGEGGLCHQCSCVCVCVSVCGYVISVHVCVWLCHQCSCVCVSVCGYVISVHVCVCLCVWLCLPVAVLQAETV